MSIFNAACVRRCPQNRRGKANATYYLSNDIANLVGPTLWGVLADAFGTGSAFIGGAVSVFVAGVLNVLLLRNILTKRKA